MNDRTSFICTCDSTEFDIAAKFVSKRELIENYPFMTGAGNGGSTLWTWGYDGTGGRLGRNALGNQSSPVQTIAGGTNWKAVASGTFHSTATKTDGTLWTWGAGLHGKIGNNSTIDQSSPVQTIAGGTNWKQISAGCCVSSSIKTDGTLWIWGGNASGQLGTNFIAVRSSPVQTISGGTNWKDVSVGQRATTATKMDGTVWSWGRNYEGQLGINNVVFRSSPIQLMTATTDWNKIANSGYHVLAIKNNGQLWGWGSNNCGALGCDPFYGLRFSSPVQIISDASSWRQVSVNLDRSAGISTDSRLRLWGNNSFSVLGTGDFYNKCEPNEPAFGLCWSCVNIGYEATAAIGTDGSLWLWGFSMDGILGNNYSYANGTFVSPVQTVAGGNNWRSVSLERNFVMALKEEDYD